MEGLPADVEREVQAGPSSEHKREGATGTLSLLPRPGTRPALADDSVLGLPFLG